MIGMRERIVRRLYERKDLLIAPKYFEVWVDEVLAALEEPTEEMVKAGTDAFLRFAAEKMDPDVSYEHVRRSMTAMIRAAKDGK